VLIARQPQAGMSLIELLIGLAIMGLLIMIGLPNMATWLQTSKIRTAGETTLAGLTLARTEAVKRNHIVRFQMVNNLTSTCIVSTSGTDWVVSLDDATGACDAASSDPLPTDPPPRIIQKRSGAEGTTSVVLAAATAGVVHFNGLGRVTSPGGAANMTQVAISNPVGGTCEHVDGGSMRCLRINISVGGDARMCDPAVTDATDPRICP
jgi:type IV fimbrial biogenesis protein FimT